MFSWSYLLYPDEEGNTIQINARVPKDHYDENLQNQTKNFTREYKAVINKRPEIEAAKALFLTTCEKIDPMLNPSITMDESISEEPEEYIHLSLRTTPEGAQPFINSDIKPEFILFFIESKKCVACAHYYGMKSNNWEHTKHVLQNHYGGQLIIEEISLNGKLSNEIDNIKYPGLAQCVGWFPCFILASLNSFKKGDFQTYKVFNGIVLKDTVKMVPREDRFNFTEENLLTWVTSVIE
jgi:hypothetical protein